MPAAAPHPITLRIITWNIHKGVRGLAFRKRLEIHNMQAAMQRLNADIICLQEVRKLNRKEAAHFTRWPELPQAEFLAPPGYEAVYRTNAITRHGEHGNALLSRHAVLRVAHEDMSDHRFEQRGLLHAVLSVQGQDVHVIVVHLGLIAASRQRQMTQLSHYIAREIPKKDALIVAGDFNSPIAPIRWAQSALGVAHTSKTKKTPPLLHALGNMQRQHATFPARLPVVQLDHVFVRHGKIMSQHTPHESSHEANWSRMSDHLPLIVEVQL
jgi:endonuclease/exonuclease/phosphatase family metal-dependent hydrolase